MSVRCSQGEAHGHHCRRSQDQFVAKKNESSLPYFSERRFQSKDQVGVVGSNWSGNALGFPREREKVL